MKTRFLIIMSVLVLFPIQLVYAPPPSPEPEDDFRYSAHVITGKIISSEIIKDPREDNSAETFYDIIIYQVKVEEWHKNPLENDIITVYGTHYPNDVIPEPDWGVVEFEIGDTVYLYINETDDGLEFRKYASKLLQKYIAEESKGYPPPLKQIKSGVSIDEIQCKQNLTLVIKQNGSPACVKPETKTKLIERGWAKGIERESQQNDNGATLLERYKNEPVVEAFYSKYDDVNESQRIDHVSYAAGNDDDFRVQMNLYFDENYELTHMRLYCYVGGEFQHEVAQEDILHYLQNYHCLTYKTSILENEN